MSHAGTYVYTVHKNLPEEMDTVHKLWVGEIRCVAAAQDADVRETSILQKFDDRSRKSNVSVQRRYFAVQVGADQGPVILAAGEQPGNAGVLRESQTVFLNHRNVHSFSVRKQSQSRYDCGTSSDGLAEAAFDHDD
jgi:hypothetical protein